MSGGLTSTSAITGHDPDILSTIANLALWTGKTGDAAGARDQHAALLRIRERALGPSTPTRSTPALIWPAPRGMPGTRPGPATSALRCCL
jgi:hypothetical protein